MSLLRFIVAVEVEAERVGWFALHSAIGCDPLPDTYVVTHEKSGLAVYTNARSMEEARHFAASFMRMAGKSTEDLESAIAVGAKHVVNGTKIPQIAGWEELRQIAHEVTKRTRDMYGYDPRCERDA